MNCTRSFPLIRLGLMTVLFSVVAGCDRQEVKVYQVPKESAAPATQPAALPPNHPPLDSVPPATGDNAAKPQWTVPPNWKEEPPTAMLLAKFSATVDGARADVTVSSFDGDMGGILGNVNRWRGQVGLAPVGEAELAQLVQKLDVQSDQGSLVDMKGTDVRTGQPARLISVAVPHNGQTWFFKILGDVKVVAHEKEAFVKFVQTVKLPHAP